MYAEHGELLRALAEASSRDPDAASAWSEFTEPVRVALTERIRREVEAGRIAGIEPEPTVRALMSMNLRCFFEQLAGKPDPDVEGLVDTLHRIWFRTFYGLDPRRM